MSLGPFLPPICDKSVGDDKVHYLVDGGYVNVVPVDVMTKAGNQKRLSPLMLRTMSNSVSMTTEIMYLAAGNAF